MKTNIIAHLLASGITFIVYALSTLSMFIMAFSPLALVWAGWEFFLKIFATGLLVYVPLKFLRMQILGKIRVVKMIEVCSCNEPDCLPGENKCNTCGKKVWIDLRKEVT